MDKTDIKVEINTNPSEFKIALAKVVLGSVAGFVAQVGTAKMVDKVVEFRRSHDTVEVPVP